MSFYMCRYNLPIANKAISDTFNFSKGDMGLIITTSMWAYAFGQVINGLLSDRLGGKHTMLIGAIGTIVMNLLFGIASFWGLLGLFVAIRGIDGYMQSFGSPGMIKINVSWFNKRERGQFAGTYGFMINLGRFLINQIGPAILAGFVFLGMWQVPAMHWRWLFWVPSVVASVIAFVLYFAVKNTPEEAGYHIDDLEETEPQAPTDVRTHRPGILEVLRKIGTNPVIWVIAIAYACTGTVRHSLDHWYIRYFLENHQIDINDSTIILLGFLTPLAASTGSLLSGIISDRFFNGARAQIAAWVYFSETVIILAAAQIAAINKDLAMISVVLIAFTANSTHSLIGVAAAMDIGGKKMVGFTAGLIDAFQYLGGGLAGIVLGNLLDGTGITFRVYQWAVQLLTGASPHQITGWDVYFYFMAPFGLFGFILIYSADRISKHRGVTL